MFAARKLTFLNNRGEKEPLREASETDMDLPKNRGVADAVAKQIKKD